jgi:hypothetical protein
MPDRSVPVKTISFILQQIPTMYRLGFVFLLLGIVACGGKGNQDAGEEGFSYSGFAALFREVKLPFQYAEADLAGKSDTTVIRSAEFPAIIPDSVRNRLVPKGAKARYIALGKVAVPKSETYFFVKVIAGTRRSVLLMTFDKEGQFAAAFPFLLPDNDASTTQASSMDRQYTISRTTVRRKGSEVIGEGKDVFVFNGGARQYTLIMTDLLDEGNQELINPIDTLPRTRRFAGDYVKGKRNIVSIRDGRSPSQALAFVHLEKENGDCIAELKGEILFTSTTTAVYRQGGDPCVLQFSFTASSVTLKEEQGCGNHRGLNCLMEGSYPKKREPKAKVSSKKGAKK